MSMQSDDVEFGVAGMAPKVQEKMRRKSVSSKAAEVVTIGKLILLDQAWRAKFQIKFDLIGRES